MTSGTVDVNGLTIWYEKFGTGSKPLLIIPGTIGTAITDFYPQLFGENKLDFDKFTIICVDLQGWGRSRPPQRMYGQDLYDKDSECCIKVMQTLGYNKFSLLGWSEGARVALVIATFYPDSIERLIVMSVQTYNTEANTKFLQMTKDFSNWTKESVDNYLKFYKDLAEIRELWDNFVDYAIDQSRYHPNGLIDNKFSSISCPVLIMHGDLDAMIHLDHAIYLMIKLKNCELKRFSMGAHDFHHKFAAEFKESVEEFLLRN